MTSSLAEKLRSGFPNLTKSEKAVANYMVTDLKSLPYETAASIAESTGVSTMTVSRFLRGLGYNGLSELKEQLRTELESTPLLKPSDPHPQSLEARLSPPGRLDRAHNGIPAKASPADLAHDALVGGRVHIR